MLLMHGHDVVERGSYQRIFIKNKKRKNFSYWRIGKVKIWHDRWIPKFCHVFMHDFGNKKCFHLGWDEVWPICVEECLLHV